MGENLFYSKKDTLFIGLRIENELIHPFSGLLGTGNKESFAFFR
jgi:hypothetical protein